MVLSAPQTRHHLISKTSREVLAAADRAEPKIRRAMLAALDDLESQVPNLTSLIEGGNVDQVLNAISGITTDPKLVAAITDATITSAVTAGMPEAARFGIAFNEPNRRAVRWAELNAAKNIKAGGVLPGVRDAIRQVVTVGIQNGVHPSVTAKMVEGMVPLLPKHAKAVQRVASGAIDAGLSESHIQRLVARKTRKLKRYRATMIARTEAIKAANMGQQVVWQTAIDENLLPAGTKKVWLATGDSRTCPICAVMDGQVVAVEGEFKVDRQATGFTRQGSDFKVSGTKPIRRPGSPKVPPAHPQCRCTLVLETIKVPGRKKPAKPKPPSRDALDIEDAVTADYGRHKKAMARSGVDRQNSRVDGPRLKAKNAEQIGAELEERLGEERLRHVANRLIGEDIDDWIPGEAGDSVANHLMAAWADTSTGDPTAIAMQRAAADVHGIKWRKGRSMSTYDSIDNLEELMEQADALYDDIGDVMRGFTDIEYRRTQQWLTDSGFGDTVTMSRGISDASMPFGFDQTATLNPLSSFATDIDISQAFALDFTDGSARLLIVEVPKTDIVSSALTGRGSFRETEFIVRGTRPVKAHVARPSHTRTLTGEDFIKARLRPDRLTYNANWIRRLPRKR